jgi:hypothetical protein
VFTPHFLWVVFALQEAVGGRNDEPQDVSAIDTSAAGAYILNPMVSAQHCCSAVLL